MEFFPFINFTFISQKWKNESSPIELVTRSEFFWTCGCGQKSPMNQGLSFRASVFSVRKFSWDWLISFFETQHGIRGPCVVRDRAGFFFFLIFVPKMGKMGQKWAKDEVYWIYWKIQSLIFSEFGLYRTFILFAVFLQ